MSKFSLHKRRKTTGLRDYGTLACLEVSCPEIKG